MQVAMSKELKREYQIYAVAWIVVFLAPLVYLWYGSSFDSSVSFSFSLVFRSWLITLPFLIFFLIHNFFIAPFFVRGDFARYIVFSVLLLVAFAFYAHYGRSAFRPGPPRAGESAPAPPGRGLDGSKDIDFSDRPRDIGPPDGAMDESGAHRGAPTPPMGEPEPRGEPEDGGFPHDWPIAPPGWLQVLICVLMLGANLTAKFYLKTVANERRLRELEKENLTRQLEYLRYQIKPHFFMNTLNNIHALVDIDPQKAKQMILELSRLMRYILYDGGRTMVSLDKETEFLNHYISLMKLRYPDKVRIDVSLPTALPYMEVPPLLFVTFVENAFKHGVSYDRDSFITVSMETGEEKLIFRCSNSRHSSQDEDHSGIGLANARKRLELLYGSEFTLQVDEDPLTYDVLLTIPLSTSHNNTTPAS